jgi:hypothetical protein
LTLSSPATAGDRTRTWVNRRVNPLVLAMLVRGFGPPTYAVVETIGRRPAAGGDMLTIRIDLD